MIKKLLVFFMMVAILATIPPNGGFANSASIKLGNEVLQNHYMQLLQGKRIGLLTNQTGVDSTGASTIDLVRQIPSVSLHALFAPAYGLDGKTTANQEKASYTHPALHIPVYSLNAKTVAPTKAMFSNIDVFLVDLQDSGSRTSPYLASLYIYLQAARDAGKPVIVLDRPNPLGGITMEGPILEDPYQSAIGIDNLPLAHGMTIGELAQFFNRKIGANLIVIPMEGYTRSKQFADTGLAWVPSTPDLPDLQAVISSMAAGLTDGLAMTQEDHYAWIGGPGIDSQQYSNLLNFAGLPGVVFVPETHGTSGGVRLNIFDARLFNPAKTGLYAIAYAHSLAHFALPKSNGAPTQFDLALGTNKIAALLEKNASPEQIVKSYAPQLASFAELRKKYLIYSDTPYVVMAPVYNKPTVAAPAKLFRPYQQPKPATPSNSGSTTKPGTNTPATKPPATTVPQTKPAGKVAYLTFDDGPSPVTTKILDILKKDNIKATFFVVGRNVKGREKILQRALAEGHTIGGHTYSHNYQTIYKSPSAFLNDLELGNKMIKDAIGVEPTVFRYPGGSTNTVSLKYQDTAQYSKAKPVMSAIKAEMNQKGYHFIDWNVSNGDASTNHYTAASALQQVKQQVKKKQQVVILMHDATPKMPTVEALPAVIEFLKQQGYTFQTLSADVPTVAHVR
ncbi:UNVERIFIED_CONTAM: uncharacterized protein YbbC (DUF1343 family)/peptidoglycan/xylan/chitin deacetylase (PgdA/CDA1 family) [Brevibacillus sp. OAP136]